MVCCLIILAGIIMMIAPFAFGMDGFNGGFAIATGGVFVIIVGVVSVVVYARLSGKLDNILKKENILAHWTYAPEQWKEYTEKEHKTDWSEKKGLFFLIAAISVIVGIIVGFMFQDARFAIFFVLGLICFMGIVAWLTATINYMRNKRHPGEIYIARDGAYFTGQLHYWGGMGSHLDGASYVGSEEPLISIKYSAIALTGPNRYDVRIPVPPGEEDSARRIVSQINDVHSR